jgi:hypothetical protein
LDSIHLDEHFVKVPFRSEPNSLLPQLGGGNGAELLAPFPDRFLRHWDAPLRHHLFDIPIAQGKAKVKPYALLHNLDRETVPTISALRRFHNASFSHFLKLTMPIGGVFEQNGGVGLGRVLREFLLGGGADPIGNVVRLGRKRRDNGEAEEDNRG